MVTTAAQIEAQNSALIQQIRSGQAPAAQSASQQSAAGLGNNLSTFLTLLTKQLQNQDPLQPMDTADFTNQLVLYTQAEQQIKTNSMLENLISISRGTIGTQALGYIGKEVSFASDALYVEKPGDQQSFYYSLEAPASTLKVNILNEKGDTVRTVTMDKDKEMGAHKFVWDGKNNDGTNAPAGDYKIVISALDDQQKIIKSSTLVNARVAGLEADGNGSVNLILSGDRSIGLASILSVQEKSTSSTQPENS